jgi:two-component system sensor histidine kinase KdpD
MAQDRTDDFLQMIRLSQRGRLKVYLGYAAGVGKTYAMLQEAHRLKAEGIDVVVGLVETHGRPDTDGLLEGLEIIPKRRQEYRGIALEEMDLNAIIERKPKIVLVDELAHTNAPGNLNPKRYQDVQDILAQGIHVITTLNIQHLESLYDIVEKGSGVKVTERLPDSILTDADQIVNVDVTTEDLNDRLKEGKIYPKDRIETAFANFFKKTNLTQLRELTLRELASQLDLRTRDDQEEHISSTPDQIMVCLSSRGPNSERLLRYASRMAGRLNRNWYAVYVQTPSEEPTVIDAKIQRLLSDTLTLAKQLGAIVFTFKGEDIVSTILQFAKEYRVGHIIIGSPDKMPWWQWIMGKRSIAERLIREARDMTIVVQDTRTLDMSAVDETQEVVVPEATAPRPSIQGEPSNLSSFMSSQSILMWDMALKKDDLLCKLTDAAVRSAGIPRDPRYIEAIRQRETQGSTFFNEGVAFPHARIPELGRTCVALGLTRAGVFDVETDKPIECVFLILTPEEDPDMQIRILGHTSRLIQDRQLMEKLRSSSNPEEIIWAIHKWELAKKE